MGNRSKKTLKKLSYVVVFWDWKEQPDFKEIQKHVLEGFVYMSLPDTSSDMYALIMTKEEVTDVESDRLYQLLEEEMVGGK